MIYTYEVKKMGGENGREIIYRVEDGAWIPNDPANSDYQRYLKWVENPDALTDDYLTLPDTIESTQPDEADLTEGNN
jgi:hypothetical protein